MKKYCAIFFLVFNPTISYASDECVSELSQSSKYSDLNKIFACFSGKVKALEAKVEKLESQLGKVGDEKPSNASQVSVKTIVTKRKPAVTQTVEKKGFTFNLSHCARKGKRDVACELSVVSNKDTPLRIRTEFFGPGTIAITTSGVQHTAASVSLGASGQGTLISYRMLSGLPLRSLISFSSIPSDEEGFALLEILTDEAGKVSFRDVRFTDQE